MSAARAKRVRSRRHADRPCRLSSGTTGASGRADRAPALVCQSSNTPRNIWCWSCIGTERLTAATTASAYHATEDQPDHGLVLGYGNLADGAVEEAVRRLREAIDECG